jgi:hypothetical protein
MRFLTELAVMVEVARAHPGFVPRHAWAVQLVGCQSRTGAACEALPHPRQPGVISDDFCHCLCGNLASGLDAAGQCVRKTARLSHLDTHRHCRDGRQRCRENMAHSHHRTRVQWCRRWRGDGAWSRNRQ